MTTEDAEKTEESQKYPIVFFRVVRVFRGYLSRWLRDGCHQGRILGLVITTERDEYFFNHERHERIAGGSEGRSRQENGAVLHSSAFILLPTEITQGQSSLDLNSNR